MSEWCCKFKWFWILINFRILPNQSEKILNHPHISKWNTVGLTCRKGFFFHESSIMLCWVLFWYSIVMGFILIFSCDGFYSDILLCWVLFCFSAVYGFILTFCCAGRYSAFLVLILLIFFILSFYCFHSEILFCFQFCYSIRMLWMFTYTLSTRITS